MEIELTSGNYDEIVMKSKKPVLIDFWASWCGPCMKLAPIIEEIASERSDLVVCKANCDSEGALAEKFGIQSIPALILLKEGKVVNQRVGYCEKALLVQWLENILK